MLTDAERESLCADLLRTAEMAVAATEGLSEAQWNFRPQPEAWPISHIAEHIAVSEAVVLTTVQKMLEGPAQPQRRIEVEGKDRIIVQRVPLRGRSAPAPEAMRPTGRYAAAKRVAEAIAEGRQRTIELVRTTNADLRSYFEVHPALQLLDAYQWLLLVAAHTERHVKQIVEWKESPDYPHA